MPPPPPPGMAFAPPAAGGPPHSGGDTSVGFSIRPTPPLTRNPLKALALCDAARWHRHRLSSASKGTRQMKRSLIFLMVCVVASPVLAQAALHHISKIEFRG